MPVTDDLQRTAFEVGNEVVLVAGVQGKVEAVTDDTVTINGHTLPRKLNTEGGVRYLSTMWPQPTVVIDDCDGECGGNTDALERRIQQLRDAIEREHYARHGDGYSFRLCPEAVCRLADQR